MLEQSPANPTAVTLSTETVKPATDVVGSCPKIEEALDSKINWLAEQLQLSTSIQDLSAIVDLISKIVSLRKII